MRNYCLEISKREGKNDILMIVISFIAIPAMLAMLIYDLITNGYRFFVVFAICFISLFLVMVIIKLFRVIFKTEKNTFDKELLLQAPASSKDFTLEDLYYDVNSDLNVNGREVGPLLIGDRWIFGMASRAGHSSVPTVVNLDYLQSFTVGIIVSREHTPVRRRPALVIITEKNALQIFYCKASEIEIIFEYFNKLFPQCNETERFDTDLRQWMLSKVMALMPGKKT